MGSQTEDIKDVVIPQVVNLALVVLAIYLQRKLSSPDAFRVMRMRGALTVKRFAENQAGMWSAISARAATSYQKARV